MTTPAKNTSHPARRRKKRLTKRQQAIINQIIERLTL